MKEIFNRIHFIHALGALLLVACILPSCDNNRHDVDVSRIEVEFDSQRLDQDMFRAAPDDFKQLNQELHEKYGTFYQQYLSKVIGVGKPTDPMVSTHLREFVTDPNWRETQDQIDEVFGDMESYDEEIERAFRYYRYHFPKDIIPTVIYYNSGFNVGIYPTNQYLGVGLEWFLGTENAVIQRLAIEEFPQYIKEKLRPKYLVNNAVKGWLMVKNQALVEKENLINLMIFHGKILYLMDALFPDASDEIKMNYTPEDLKWCQRNEYNIWAHFIDADVLYSSDPKNLAGFLSDGPFTAAFEQDSPARTGVWMGWQIMRQYMDKNPEVTLSQMLAEDNNQKFLKYYKP